MNTKQYLKQYKRILERIQQMEKEITFIESQIESTGGIGDGMPKGTDVSDKTGRIASMLADQKSQYKYIKTESIKIRNEIVNTINQVEDDDLSKLLYDKYIRDMSWKNTAKDINLSLEHVRGYLHRKALESVSEILEGNHHNL